MKDVLSKNDKCIQHEFGCGVRVRFEKVEFSDGLKIWVPREADNSIHECPKLPNGDEHEDWNEDYFAPELDEDYQEWEAAGFGPGWNQDQVVQHLEELDRNFGYCTNLEFKNTRQREKEFLVESLEATSHFYFYLTLNPLENDFDDHIPLPPCLDLWDEEGVGTFSPLELLGLFYEMDGLLLDAKKCWEINLEMGWDAKWCQSKIDQINKNIADIEEEKLRVKNAVQSIRRITATGKVKPDVEIEDESIIWKEIKKWENKDLKEYMLTKIPKEEFISKLKNAVRGYRTKIVEGEKKHIPITLYDIIKKRQAKEEKRLQTRKNQIDLDLLSLGEKVTILKLYVKNEQIKNCLDSITDHRNVLDHSGEYYPEGIELVNQDTRLGIKKCKDYFEKSKNS